MDERQRHIRIAQSCAGESRQAVREFHAQVHQPDSALVIFFCSSDYDLDALADEINLRFAGTPVVGCTTADGEIGPAGYREWGISGASFPDDSFTAVTGLIEHLQGFDVTRGRRLTRELMRELEARGPQPPTGTSFALLLIDGLSKREELVAHALQTALGTVPLLGGSAGDSMRFQRTAVFHDGAFRGDSAVLVLLRSRFPVHIFQTQHFVTRDEPLVVTESDAANRTVQELNGRPAAEEYARLIGVSVDTLTPERFAAAPVVVLIDGAEYVRSIQKANADRSLTFFCAIELGVVLRIAEGADLKGDLESRFREIDAAIGPPQAVLAFDCVLRRLELSREGLEEEVGELLRSHRTVGFSTYGEQFAGVHVNQTFTGIAIGG